MRGSLIACVFALSFGCATSPAKPPPPPTEAAAPASAPSSSAPTPEATFAYPVGRACTAPDALTKEGRSLPPRASWLPVSSASQRLSLRVPQGLFTVDDGPEGLRLTSTLTAEGLGPHSAPRAFAMHLRRYPEPLDALLHKHVPPEASLVFPALASSSFVASPEGPLAPGFATRTTVGGKPSFMWIVGVEGYNTDVVAIALGPSDTALVTAAWNGAIMSGQPECYERTVIARVMDSLAFD